MPSRPPIDIDHLSAMTGGDPALAEEVIGIFKEQAEIWSRLLDPALPPSQWADAAHTLKGSAVSVGAASLGEACSAAETLGRRAAPPGRAEAGVALSNVKDELGTALEAAAAIAYELAVSGAFPPSNARNS